MRNRNPFHPSLIAALLALLCAAFSDLPDPAMAAAFSKIGAPPVPAEILDSNGHLRLDRHLSWGRSDITWRFDASFLRAFNPQLQDQVRRALGTWARPDRTPTWFFKAPLSYRRLDLTSLSIVDLQSLALHEIGHALGFLHPDNAVRPNPTVPNLNFRHVAGSVRRVPTFGNRGEVMHSLLWTNEFNRVLTEDELFALDFGYPRGASLREETRPGVPADITFVAVKQPPASMGVVKALTELKASSSSLTSAVIKIVAGGVGMRTISFNWDYRHTTLDTSALRVETAATNGEPIDVYRRGGYSFRSGSTRNDHPEHGLHEWSALGLPPNRTVHVGITLDRTDREEMVLDSMAIHPSGTSPAGLSSAQPYVVRRVTGRVASSSAHRLAATVAGSDTGKIVDYLGEPFASDVVVSGLRLSSSANVILRGLGVAPVDDMGLTLADLTEEGLSTLRDGCEGEACRYQELDLPEIELGPGRGFYLLFDGEEGELPEEILEAHNYLMLYRPNLANRELFVFFETQTTDGAIVGNYGLIGSQVTGDPEAALEE